MLSSGSLNEYDVASISFKGYCPDFGMEITEICSNGKDFSIKTTGAMFKITSGRLKIYQGLKEQRCLARAYFDSSIEFKLVNQCKDHVLFYSPQLNIGIYGDSTCILAPKEDFDIQIIGNFKPEYEGNVNGELLLIDSLGGIEIYPQRYEGDYTVNEITLGTKKWVADYTVKPNERVMIAAFPGRPFNWEQSFKSNLVVTSGGHGTNDGHPFGFGVLASNSIIEEWSKFAHIIAVHWNGLWLDKRPHGPYILANKPELERMISTAHSYGMKVIVHCSLFYFYRTHHDIESFYEQVKAVHKEVGTDGVYIDGLLFDVNSEQNDDKIANWEMIRRFRQLFGPEGIIVYHGDSKGTLVSTIPNVDTYCDITHYGEGVSFSSVDEPYIKYQINKYNISNTVGVWMRHEGEQPSDISDNEITDAIINMNCRDWWNGYAYWRRITPDRSYSYYLDRLKELQWAYNLPYLTSI